MKIYSRSEWELRMKCPYCISEIGVQMGDVKYTLNRDYTGGTDPSYYATCAVCSGSIHLPGEKVPSHVMAMARDRLPG